MLTKVHRLSAHEHFGYVWYLLLFERAAIRHFGIFGALVSSALWPTLASAAVQSLVRRHSRIAATVRFLQFYAGYDASRDASCAAVAIES